MRRSWAAVTVGALVLVVASISYFLIRSTSERASGSQGYTVWALFRDASGLFEKSRVQTAGISIGQIDERKLDPTTAQARITIRIQPGIKLWSNAVVSKKSASLLGEYYLEIDPGTPFALVHGQRMEMTELKDGEQIKNVREPTGMADLMADVGTILPILKDILLDVHKLTSGTITDIADQREQPDRDQLDRARAAVEPRRSHRRQHRGRHLGRGGRREGRDQERSRDHRVDQDPGRLERGRGEVDRLGGARLAGQAAVDGRQPRQDPAQHGDHHLAAGEGARGRRGGC